MRESVTWQNCQADTCFPLWNVLLFVTGHKARSTPRTNLEIYSKTACIKGCLTILEVLRKKRDKARQAKMNPSPLHLPQFWNQSPYLVVPHKAENPKEREEAIAACNKATERPPVRLHQWHDVGGSGRNGLPGSQKECLWQNTNQHSPLLLALGPLKEFPSVPHGHCCCLQVGKNICLWGHKSHPHIFSYLEIKTTKIYNMKYIGQPYLHLPSSERVCWQFLDQVLGPLLRPSLQLLVVSKVSLAEKNWKELH